MTQYTILYIWYLCKRSELWATTGGCLSFWACCWVTLSVMEGVLTPPLPEGRLDTLHDSLYLYLSIIACPLSSYAQLCSLSLHQHPPFLLPSASLPSISFSPPPLPSSPSIFPSELHWAMAVNRLQESRQGLHQDQSCKAQMGPFVHSAGLLTGSSTGIPDGFQSLSSTEADRSASIIMSDNDAL